MWVMPLDVSSSDPVAFSCDSSAKWTLPLRKMALPTSSASPNKRLAHQPRGFTICVGVDVVAEEQEQVGLLGDNRVPDRLRLPVLRTGAEGDALDGGVGEREPRKLRRHRNRYAQAEACAQNRSYQIVVADRQFSHDFNLFGFGSGSDRKTSPLR